MVQTLTQLLSVVFIVTTMTGVGLILRVGDITASLGDRRWVLRALLANFVVLPALAVGVSRLLGLDTMLSAALLVLATAPAGPVVIKAAAMAKGDSALAVGLVVSVLTLGVVTQPVVLPLLLDGVTVHAGTIVRILLFTVLIPLLLGLALRARAPALAARLQLPLQRVSSISLFLFVTLLPALQWRELVELLSSRAFPAALLFAAACAATGWLLGGPQAGPRRILTLCCSQPNLGAAFVIANQNFQDPRVTLMLLMALVAGALVMLPQIFIFARRPLAPEANRIAPERGGVEKTIPETTS